MEKRSHIGVGKRTLPMRRFLGTALVFTVVTALGFVGTQTASAVEVSGTATGTITASDDGMFFSPEDLDALAPGGSAALDPEFFLQGLEELEASTADRIAIVDGDRTNYQYIVPEGSLTLPSAADVEDAILESEENVAAAGVNDFDITPFLAIHISGFKTAVGFNTTDQQALQGGAAAVLGIALCAIPGVGWAACGIIGVVIAVAGAYVFAHGICSGGRVLWWYDVSGGSVTQCRSSAPF
jgi:hypothetical protein